MFKYLGSKAQLAPTYDPPVHDIIIEPFAGAAAYSMYWLARRPEMSAVLYDVDSLVVELWIRLLGMDPQDLWDYPNPVKGERTADILYLSTAWNLGGWGRAHKGSDYQVTEWQADSFPQGKRLLASTLAAVRGRVTIFNSSYEESPGIEATWFIDPPYQIEGHLYASGNALDFAALGEWCHARQGQVIVCESLGADWLPFSPHRMTSTVANGSSTEVVWYSHPEPTLFDFV